MNEALRRLFPITERYIYMNHAAVSPLPKPTVEAMRYQTEQVMRHGTVKLAEWWEAIERTRQKVARLVNARPEEIAFLRNTSDGLSVIANGLRWRDGDNVVTAECEFPANVYPWMRLRAYGVELRLAPERNGRVEADDLLALVDRRTRVLAISFVQYASGFRVDLERLGEFCRKRDILFVVDAIQGLGVLPFDVERFHVDVFAANGHKWLLGPEGAAVLYISSRVIDRLEPTLVGWMSVRNWMDSISADELTYDLTYRDGALRFESGVLNACGLCGLGASVELLLEVGIERIEEHVSALGRELCERLQAKGYHLVSSRRPGETSGIFCFTHPRYSARELAARLEERGIIVSARLGRLRISPHLYNTREEIIEVATHLP
ncbi:MAG: aminotransferase class V-fold PLP-dependent enzyme [Blastocatellia bacterium]|nr:aminotransferase class V-fold PLP-dependent enzyme [Blastocatellia bacterium]MCS7156830.1 aminotransferase class V-fold PLP-dependent enzyme [Blastocatellia bacterium]MCX7752788.1 aminotransferase class V-fold PLP-dependent enzyme [Blastocatellia bacterium]MDW8167521.1 aminotransferase class V-fold PLP-dependent enzyme [Acidobacteriota bacterium]MDW8256868.1 aminotransferase class V-fold PLP-dependent enzyme [Acidobacteriota bacterium]